MAWSWNPLNWFSSEPEPVVAPTIGAPTPTTPVQQAYGGKKRKTRRGGKKSGKKGKTGRSKRA